jgi:hypothetical protein
VEEDGDVKRKACGGPQGAALPEADEEEDGVVMRKAAMGRMHRP